LGSSTTRRHIEQYQQRVVEERTDLDKRMDKLADFIDLSPKFDTLSSVERGRLHRQLEHMRSYSRVLDERIEAFVL